jgi:hypothetical protein
MGDSSLTGREKWELFLANRDVPTLVSPLCDDWALDIPYHWPYDDRPDPFPPGHAFHALSQQMAMAGVCKWDPTFLASVPFEPLDPAIKGKTKVTKSGNVTRTESVIETPYGELTAVTEQGQSQHVAKSLLATEEDYRRMTWLTRQQMKYDVEAAIAAGQAQRKAVGNKGMLGTWANPPISSAVDHDQMFFHLYDWPDAVEELRQAQRELMLARLKTLRDAGYDYLFYVVEGTEWLSPDFLTKFVLEDTREMFRAWRELGGFILWHSCGRVKLLIESGFYNQLKPDVFETITEAPVGNVPSMAWARHRLDPAIATKGNVPLELMLLGTPEQVREQVRRVRNQTRGSRHIMGLSDDILHNTPLANALAFVEESRAQ